jgi:steroid delta-isomerase-like uncharacterized protein
MTTAAPPAQSTNGELVRWAFDRINDHDVEPLKQFWTPETLEHFPDRTCKGADEIAAYFEDTFKAVPDLRMDVVSLAEQNDDVFVQWHLTGTHEGTLLGIEATGKRLGIDGIDHFVIRDGRVISNFIKVDQLDYARQLGMMPPDGSAGDKAFKGAFNLKTRLTKKLRG